MTREALGANLSKQASGRRARSATSRLRGNAVLFTWVLTGAFHYVASQLVQSGHDELGGQIVPLLALRASAMTSAVALSCIRSCGTHTDLLYEVYVSLQPAAIIAESTELEVRPSARPCTNRYQNRGSAGPKVRSSR